MTRANMYAGVRECAQWTPYVLSIMGICGSVREAGETKRTSCSVRVEVERQKASTAGFMWSVVSEIMTDH